MNNKERKYQITEEKMFEYNTSFPPQVEEEDTRPMKGTKLTGDSQPHHNIFLAAKKKSGKTVTIFNILKACADKYTTIIAFVGTLDSDKNWIGIQEWCLDKDIDFIGYSNFDQLEAVILMLEKENRERREALENGDDEPEKPKSLLRLYDDEDDEKGPPKDRRKYQTPKYIIIADDLGEEMKHNKHWVSLIKKHRHYRAWTISSSQYFNDLSTSARKNMDLILIFKNINLDKLEQIHKDADVEVPFDVFVEAYRKAIAVGYKFLWINTSNGEMRKGFNVKLKITSE